MISRLRAGRIPGVWRLGHSSDPCAFPPRPLCSWRNRFDDPQRKYRTLYTAREPVTCLRELLADLRPNSKALQEFEALYGESVGPTLTVAGVVSPQWRRAHALIPATIEPASARLARIEATATLAFLRTEHQSLLHALGIPLARPKEVRSRDRIVTQQFSRSLYDREMAGIAFQSRLDGKPCFALFEERALLKPRAKAISMATDWPDLVQVCGEYNLILQPMKKAPRAPL